MATLKDILLTDENRPKLVKDCVDLVNRQVSAKKGFSGIAIKGAYSTVKAIKRGFVTSVIDSLLDEWMEKIGEFEGEHRAAGTDRPLTDYLIQEKSRVAESLISVTDLRAETTKHKTAKKVYGKLRSSALVNVENAVPDLARLVDSYR